MSVSTRVMESVNVRYLTKEMAATTPYQPAKVTVDPGKIEIISTENKFPPIHITPSDLSCRPKRAMNTTVPWISLDFVQNDDAKYYYVIIQVDISKIGDLLETLLCAWSDPKAKTSNSLIKDNADEIMRPVPSINAVSKPTTPPKSQNTPTLSASQRVFEAAQVRILKKGATSPTSARPAKIIVLPGKIEIISTENKFTPIHIKPSDLTSRPKRSTNQNVLWISLDFVQTIDSKYHNVNVQAYISKIDDLVDTLLYAWTETKAKASNSLFNDNPDEIMRPVLKAPPNAVSRRTTPPKSQNTPTMSASQRVFEAAQIRILNKGMVEMTKPREARIRVSPGKIEIISTEYKFFPITIKPSDLTNPPTRSADKNLTWIPLYFIQNVHAKYQYINVQADISKIDDLLETLLFAWSNTKAKTSNSLLNDNADEIMRPVQNSTPLIAVSSPTNPLEPTKKEKINSDEEGRAQREFYSDFANPQQKYQKALALRGMFNDYGITDGNGSRGVPLAPVHNKVEPKKNRGDCDQSKGQVTPTMTLVSNKQVYEGAQVRFLKKGQSAWIGPRPARIDVIPGKIEIISTENKFPPIHIKPSYLTKQPKRPDGKTVSWIALAFVQTIDAKYQYVNIQADMLDVDRLLDTLLHAWSGPNAKNSLLFSDNADEIMRPVHKFPHLNVTASYAAKEKKTLALRGMFDDYGITDGNGSRGVPLEPVHNKVEPKKNVTASYAAQANILNKNYSASVNAPRPSSKDMLDAGILGSASKTSAAAKATDLSRKRESRTSCTVPAKSMRLDSPSVEKSENSDQSKGEIDSSESSSLLPPPSIPWLSQLHTGRKENEQEGVEASAETTATSQMASPSAVVVIRSEAAQENEQSAVERMSTKDTIDAGKVGEKISCPLPAQSIRLDSPCVEKNENSDQSKGEVDSSKSSSLLPPPSIPWLSQLHAARKENELQGAATDKTTTTISHIAFPSVLMKTVRSEGLEESKELKEIEKEFNMMATEVYRLDKKDRDDLMSIMKTIVKETVKRKTEGRKNE